MKHKIIDDVNVNVTFDIPTQDIENLIEKVTDEIVFIVVVATAAHILRKWVT